MSDTPQGPGWWMADDERWYPPDRRSGASTSPPVEAQRLPYPGDVSPTGAKASQNLGKAIAAAVTVLVFALVATIVVLLTKDSGSNTSSADTAPIVSTTAPSGPGPIDSATQPVTPEPLPPASPPPIAAPTGVLDRRCVAASPEFQAALTNATLLSLPTSQTYEFESAASGLVVGTGNPGEIQMAFTGPDDEVVPLDHTWEFADVTLSDGTPLILLGSFAELNAGTYTLDASGEPGRNVFLLNVTISALRSSCGI